MPAQPHTQHVSSMPLSLSTQMAAYNGSVAPEECEVMISFNAGTAGEEACALCRKLKRSRLQGLLHSPVL